MNKIRTMLFIALFAATATFAQNGTEKTVSKLAQGTVLTETDLGFLSMVANAAVETNRGAASNEVTIGNVKYSVGKTLTTAEAKSLQSAIKKFQKTYKAPDASRGDGLCYYWYYYCDYYGYCYWYKYWYYC